MTLLLREEDVLRLLSIQGAIPVMEETFRMAGQKQTQSVPRTRMPFPGGFLQYGPAALQAKQVMGFKVWANFGSPFSQVWNFLYSMERGELIAIVQAHAIGKFRTAATTAVAVKYLSLPEAECVGLYGAGVHAEAQLEAICEVRPIHRAVVYSRRPEQRETFCRKMSERLRIEVVAGTTPEAVARQADIIVTITNSDTPILRGEWLTKPVMVAGVGANQWYERELDGRAIQLASLVVVDDKEQAKIECGDLLWPISHGLLTWDRVEELGDVVAGRVQVPDPAENVILFESQGVAIEDVAITARAYELARESGVGTEIAL